MILPEYRINRIRSLTSLVQPRPEDPDQPQRQQAFLRALPQRQQAFLRALATIPHLSIHYGRFTIHPKMRRLTNPAPGAPLFARVLIPEEKGSDVNLATHLLVDAFGQDAEVAVVVSNDSELIRPIEMARAKLDLQVGVINPYENARPSRQRAADFYRTLSEGALRASHFPPTLTEAHGTITKPPSW